MKHQLVALALLSLLGTSQAQDRPHPYALPKQAMTVAANPPDWFVRLPEDTADMVFGVGTATSADEQMAYDKARLQAERKIVEMLSGRVRSQVISNRTDNGDDLIESTSVTVQKNAEGDLLGAQRVDSQATFDGRRYKVYVLVRYPLNENNTFQRAKNTQQLKREAELRVQRARQDLDNHSAQRKQDAIEADQRLQQQVGPKPQSYVEPVRAGAESVNTSNGTVQLLDVDNKEYKDRRSETLAKPNAVIGQTTISGQ
jgi:hypothetical protein